MDMPFFAQQIEQAIPDSKATVTTEDQSKFLARVISNAFDGLTTVKRHQMIYKVLNEPISSGAIHALTIEAYTEKEWAEQAN